MHLPTRKSYQIPTASPSSPASSTTTTAQPWSSGVCPPFIIHPPLHPSIPSSSRRLLVFFLIDNIQAVASDSPRCVQVTQCTGATLTHIPTSSKKEESGAIRAASLFPVWVFSPFTSEPSSQNISDGVDVGYVLLPIQRAIQVM